MHSGAIRKKFFLILGILSPQETFSKEVKVDNDTAFLENMFKYWVIFQKN